MIEGYEGKKRIYYYSIGPYMENISDKKAVSLFKGIIKGNQERLNWVHENYVGLFFWQNCQTVFKTWSDLGIE
jgi:hypothetical protein